MDKSFGISRRDVIWSYLAQLMSLGSHLITLPIILAFLTQAEVGFNYLMVAIYSLVALFDFGFAPQIARSITYIVGGSKDLTKEGIGKVDESGEVNMHLLAVMINTVSFLYKRISVYAVICMSTLGTIYIYRITGGFQSIENVIIIWVMYIISVYINIYYSYYNSLLIGIGRVADSKKAMVYSKIVQIFLLSFLLYFGTGLIGVIVSNLVSSFVDRIFCKKFFFTNDMKKLKDVSVSKLEIRNCFDTIWYNSKKLGVINIAASSLGYLTLFIVGLFLTLEEVGSYGIMIQLGTVLSTISMTLFYTSSPKMSYYYVNSEMTKLKTELAVSLFVFYVMFIFGGTFIVAFGEQIFSLLQSQTVLPDPIILTIFFSLAFIERNQALFSQVLLFENRVPFMKASIITGLGACFLVFLALYAKLGILGVVVAQGVPTLSYSAWKWPTLVLKKFKINFREDIIFNGFECTMDRLSSRNES